MATNVTFLKTIATARQINTFRTIIRAPSQSLHTRNLARIIQFAALCALVLAYGFRSQAHAGTIFPDNVLGTWRLNANGYRADVLLAEWRLHQDVAPEPFGLWTNPDGSTEILSSLSYEWKTRTLRFSRPLPGGSQWYVTTASEGVLTGRFASISGSTRPTEMSTAYQYHVTGWNDQVFSQSIVPRVWDIQIGGEYRAKIRIDRADSGSSAPPTQFIGRFKIYATNSARYRGEELEYDLNVSRYDGRNLTFSRNVAGLVQTFSGTAEGRNISGAFYNGSTYWGSWFGERAEVLTYGLANKSTAARADWERKTRTILRNLVMAGNPTPSQARIVLDRLATLEGPDSGPTSVRDDEPSRYVRNRNVREITIDYDIPSRYGQIPMRRRVHGLLAVPTTAPPAGGFPILLAVNGHHGSAWTMMSPMDQGMYGYQSADSRYFYADTFARRGYVVFALDISHHANADVRGRYSPTDDGADPAHGLLTSQAIKAVGFDSDWEEDGERAWDGMQVISWLLSRSDINPNKVLVTGLSMGGEVTAYVGALDPRVTAVVASGFSPDLDVMVNYANHGCYKWALANIREYMNVSDLFSLIAPRPLVIQTGISDYTYSYSPLVPPYAADKQVARRIKTAYLDSGWSTFAHVLHNSEHRWRFGLTGPFGQTGMRLLLVGAPRSASDIAWQTDTSTFQHAPDLLTLLGHLGWR